VEKTSTSKPITKKITVAAIFYKKLETYYFLNNLVGNIY